MRLNVFNVIAWKGFWGKGGKKEKYRREQGNKNLFQGTWEQLNLYEFSLKGDLDGKGKRVSRYDKQGKYMEKLSEHEKMKILEG